MCSTYTYGKFSNFACLMMMAFIEKKEGKEQEEERKAYFHLSTASLCV
jgi:hypothetical protein